MVPTRIVLASGNAGKIREIGQMVTGLGITLISQTACEVPEVEETGGTFIENALLKARNAASHTGLPALADDSGLVVDALQGAPGIYSARYAGATATSAANNAKLLAALAEIPEPERTARFYCVMVYLRHAHDPVPLICIGKWEGCILSAPRGDGGFGYDPLFLEPALRLTAAELDPDTKNRLSHRGQALRAWLTQMETLAG